MNEVKHKLAEIYQYALSGHHNQSVYKISESELQKLLAMADAGSVYPMIVDQLYSSDVPAGLIEKYTAEAILQTCSQAQISAQFLTLYRFLAKRGLKPVVLGGIVCRSLYSQPEQLAVNKEELLIPADQLDQYHEVFSRYGMKPDSSEKTYSKGQLRITLRTDLFQDHSSDDDYFSGLLNDCSIKTIEETIYDVPVTAPEHTAHLLYLISSAFRSFVSGTASITQISDILLFTLQHSGSISWDTVISACQNIHISEFVSAIYRIGEDYLVPDHYPESLKKLWQTDTSVLNLLEDILGGGEFNTPAERQMHTDNLKRYAQEYLNIYGDNHFSSDSGKNESDRQKPAFGKEKKPEILKRLRKWIRQSALTAVLSPIYIIISWIEYWILNLVFVLMGDRTPTESEKAAVRENVTFIAKSFQRQNLVKELCRNISHMYPGVSIIIADDSDTPLKMDQDNVQVIQLPFNSGLSAGLKAALEEVRTPFVMRMDDDELLMIRSKVHRELKYMLDHPEIDLIGFGHTTALRCHSPRRNFDEYRKAFMDDAPRPLKIPHLTRIDHNHTVLGKVANIYLAKTEALRKVGFDPNIKVIDHHDFFWRAAGVITSAIAEDTVVFHRHNPYLKQYNSYRSDFRADLEYINKNRKKIIREVRNEKQIH